MGTKNIKYHLQVGVKETCTNRIMEATKGVDPRDIKGNTKYYFLFDSWLSSNKSAEAAMDVGVDMIGINKTNKKLLCKDIIENLTKDCAGGSYLTLKRNSTVLGYRPLIDIG